jgi:ABC-2 type transport system permease protein
MRRPLLVAHRELLENVRTKGFWIGLLVFPVLITASVIVPALLDRAKDVRRYAVIDESGWLLPAIDERATYDDTLRLLRFVKEKTRAGEGEVAKLPKALRVLAPVVRPAPEEQLAAMAKVVTAQGRSALGAEGGGARISDELRAQVAAHQTELLLWQASLPAKEARRLGARIRRERYQRIDVPAGTEAPEAWAKERLSAKSGGLFAYFVIGADPLAGSEPNKYVSNNLTDDDLREWFSQLATSEVEARRFEREGITTEVARRIQEPVTFQGKQVSETGEETAVRDVDELRQWAPVVFVYLLWIAVFSVSNMLLTNTIEEKSSRIIEVLLSSVSPVELLVGKVLGIAATGLLVVGFWALCALGALSVGPRLLGAPAGFDLSFIASDPVFLSSFVVYFLLGYLLYGALLVGVGSICSSLKDAQNFMGPVMLLLIVPLFAMVPVSRDPNGMLAKVLSYVPPFTPFVMMNRAAGPPETWEYFATTVLLVLAIGATFWMSAKVFRIGILMTGKPPKLGEVLRWIKAPVGVVPEARG